MHLCHQPGRGYQPPDAFHQTGITHIVRCSAVSAGPVEIPQQDRLHLGAGVNGGLEQGPVKDRHLQSIRCGALGEDADGPSLMQGRGQLPACLPRRSPPASLDEYGAGPGAQQADQRPGTDLRFRHEDCRKPCRDDEDVQPGDMVADNEALRGKSPKTVGSDSDLQDTQQLPGPDAHRRALSGVAVHGVSHQRHIQAG